MDRDRIKAGDGTGRVWGEEGMGREGRERVGWE